ncbi:MAG: decaprenyl-phosphate phosphoribosyltransferase [Dehalococcoidia bacterium]
MTAGETIAGAVPIGSRGLAALLVAMRPYQWPKSLLVFAAFVFSAGDAWQLDDAGSWAPLLWRTAAMAVLWCLASSATYLVNDVFDRDRDRLHPRKRYRPIARGAVSPRAAVAVAVLLNTAAIPLALALDLVAGLILAGYVTLMAAYSWEIKRVAILDVIVLTSGVIGRAVSGATTIDVEISPWLYVCAGAAAFFFAISKRWAEFRDLGENAARHRDALGVYTGEVLTQMLIISGAAALLAFALYTIESDNVPSSGAMALTIPFVAFAMFRYLLLLNGPRRGDAPDQILFTDPQILLAMAGFGGVALAVLL